MSDERNILLTIVEEVGVIPYRHRFIISIGGENGAEIRRASAPVATRDRSVGTSVGHDPEPVELTIHVEEAPCP
jgi:hypothetical protein